MRHAFYILDGPIGTEPPEASDARGGVRAFAVRLGAHEVTGRNPDTVVLQLERLVRRVDELPQSVVQGLALDQATDLRASAQEWLAVINPTPLHAGWVCLARPESAVVRLGPGCAVLAGQSGSPLVYVPAARADLLPAAPAPQWGATVSERKSHV